MVSCNLAARAVIQASWSLANPVAVLMFTKEASGSTAVPQKRSLVLLTEADGLH